jgi:hypothetical protein
MAQSVDCDATYFRIFAGDVVLFDQRLDVIAQSVFRGTLAGGGSEGGQADGLGASPGR